MVLQILLEILIVLIAAYGMVMHSGWVQGEVRHDFFRYYTNLSNLLVAMMKFVLGKVDLEAGLVVLREDRLPEVAVYE